MISVIIILAVLIYCIVIIAAKLKNMKKGNICSGRCENCAAGCAGQSRRKETDKI